jgi:hypothetical protein
MLAFRVVFEYLQVRPAQISTAVPAVHCISQLHASTRAVQHTLRCGDSWLMEQLLCSWNKLPH